VSRKVAPDSAVLQTIGARQAMGGASARAYTVGADLKPAELSRRVSSFDLAGAAAC
jgi:hypothetical protein